MRSLNCRSDFVSCHHVWVPTTNEVNVDNFDMRIVSQWLRKYISCAVVVIAYGVSCILYGFKGLSSLDPASRWYESIWLLSWCVLSRFTGSWVSSWRIRKLKLGYSFCGCVCEVNCYKFVRVSPLPQLCLMSSSPPYHCFASNYCQWLSVLFL